MEHTHLVNYFWGIKANLFKVGALSMSAYTFFVSMAILVGSLIYFYESRKVKKVSEFSFFIAVGAFIGSAIGAKLLELLINIDLVNLKNDLFLFLVSGRTIIGGLIGGTVGVWITKKITGIHEKRGNIFAPAVAMGVAIGRLGCFFNGCCSGKPSNVPWAVDFGNGVACHPTQLYEALFMFIMFFVVKYAFKKENLAPGYLFKVLMIAYFTFRFLIEFIRVERVAFWGITYFQVISVFVIIYLVFSDDFQIFRKPNIT